MRISSPTARWLAGRPAAANGRWREGRHKGHSSPCQTTCHIYDLSGERDEQEQGQKRLGGFVTTRTLCLELPLSTQPSRWPSSLRRDAEEDGVRRNVGAVPSSCEATHAACPADKRTYIPAMRISSPTARWLAGRPAAANGRWREGRHKGHSSPCQTTCHIYDLSGERDEQEQGQKRLGGFVTTRTLCLELPLSTQPSRWPSSLRRDAEEDGVRRNVGAVPSSCEATHAACPADKRTYNGSIRYLTRHGALPFYHRIDVVHATFTLAFSTLLCRNNCNEKSGVSFRKISQS
nr:hypothetical protein CFP56_12311 [Quercus suber]